MRLVTPKVITDRMHTKFVWLEFLKDCVFRSSDDEVIVPKGAVAYMDDYDRETLLVRIPDARYRDGQVVENKRMAIRYKGRDDSIVDGVRGFDITTKISEKKESMLKNAFTVAINAGPVFPSTFLWDFEWQKKYHRKDKVYSLSSIVEE